MGALAMIFGWENAAPRLLTARAGMRTDPAALPKPSITVDVVRTVWAFMPGVPEPRPHPEAPDRVSLHVPEEIWKV
ncbi:hypothetical protein ACQEU6_03780 [Spirillospora sp. CA-108201]